MRTATLWGILLLACSPAWAQFVHTQGASFSGASQATCSVSLPVGPTTGHLVTGAFIPWSVVSAVTIKDANNNIYTVSPNSPSPNENGNGKRVYMFYFLSAPSNALATITASWTGGTISCAMFTDEFSYTGSPACLAQDVTGGQTGTAASFNLPVITPISTGTLFYAAASSNTQGINAPTAGGTLGVWTGGGGAPTSGAMAEYRLSAPVGATPVQFTPAANDYWTAALMNFQIGCTPPTRKSFSY